MISLFRKLKWLSQRGRKEDELREELQFHLDEEAEQREAEGLARDQATWVARRDLGNITFLQESTRATWTWTFLEQLEQDLRYALRAMIHNRAFTALGALSLALGIGANTAVLSFVDAILLRSLPVHDPESLVLLNWRANAPERTGPGRGRAFGLHGISGSTYSDPKTGESGDIFPFGAFDCSEKTIRFSQPCLLITPRETGIWRSTDMPRSPPGSMFPANISADSPCPPQPAACWFPKTIRRERPRSPSSVWVSAKDGSGERLMRLGNRF